MNYEDSVTSMTQLKALHLKDDDKFSTGPYVRNTDIVSDSQHPYRAIHYCKQRADNMWCSRSRAAKIDYRLFVVTHKRCHITSTGMCLKALRVVY